MSINFDKPIDPDLAEMVRKMHGGAVADDGKTFLFESLEEVEQKKMKELANKSGQPVGVELNSYGDIKTMQDGTRYIVTKKGWQKLDGKKEES